MKKFFVLLFITTLLSSCADKSVYMFSYFMGGGDGLHYAYSYDGHNWTAVKNGEILLTPVVGLIAFFCCCDVSRWFSLCSEISVFSSK